jgi:hypothetical protein
MESLEFYDFLSYALFAVYIDLCGLRESALLQHRWVYACLVPNFATWKLPLA